MNGGIWKKRKSKRGVSLIEVVAAVAILAVVVTSVAAGISFSQRSVLSQGSQSAAAAEAQNLADQLISKLHGLDESKLSTVSVSGAANITGSTFPDPTSSRDNQYKIATVHDNALSGTTRSIISGYRIRVAVAYRDGGGRKFVQLTAFAAKGGGSP